MQWYEHADPFDKLLALLREMWRHLTTPVFTSLDILCLMAILAAMTRHVSHWITMPLVLAWFVLRRLA